MVVPLLVLAIALVYLALVGPVGQDWWPLHVAGELVHAHRWDAVYFPPTTTDSVAQVFRATADATVPGHDIHALTAYLSTPPVAVIFSALAGHPALSLALLRVLMVGMMLGAVLTAIQAEPHRARLWAIGAVTLSPLLAYQVYVGQTSTGFLVAATMAALPSSRRRDWFGGLALGLTILTKATPLAIAVALCVVGRRRLGLIAIGSAAVVSLAVWPWTGAEPWLAFYGVASRLTHLIAVDWNSVSIDALVLRFSRHLDGGTRIVPTSAELAVIWAVRIPVLAGAVWVAWRAWGGRLATLAVWVGWLALTPILWAYYLPALFPFVIRESRAKTVGVGLLLSASVVLVRFGVPEFWAGAFCSLGWLVAAGLMLHVSEASGID